MPLKVLVTGPTGTTGSQLVQELLDRGHTVTGLSRSPEKWGTHPNYKPVKGTQTGDQDALIKAIEGHDVVISAFAPTHDHSKNAQIYIGLIEGAWRIKAAVKAAKSKPYLIYVGGAGSLIDPETNVVCLDQPDRTWPIYLYQGPLEHLNWLRGLLKLSLFDWYYHLRDYGHSNRFLSSLVRIYTSFFERTMVKMRKDPEQRTMPEACRAALYFFEEDETFDWTFLSPPWYYRDGPKTGKPYGTVEHTQPVDKAGRWLGINNGDLAVALADEAEERKKKWVHWSCYGWQDDTLYFYNNYADTRFERYENLRK